MSTPNSDQFLEIVRCLAEARSLADVVVVGSWAEWCYGEGRLLGSGFEPMVKTMDADFLIPRLTGSAQESGDFVSIAKRRGFLYSEDRMSGSSRLFGRDDFEVEFLTPQVTDGSRRLPRSSVGVNAQQLTHLEVLARFTTLAEVGGLAVRVPLPEAYALQKMVVNSRRGPKAAADRAKVENVLPHLDPATYERVYDSLTRREKMMADGFCAEYGLESGRDLATVCERMPKALVCESGRQALATGERTGWSAGPGSPDAPWVCTYPDDYQWMRGPLPTEGGGPRCMEFELAQPVWNPNTGGFFVAHEDALPIDPDASGEDLAYLDFVASTYYGEAGEGGLDAMASICGTGPFGSPDFPYRRLAECVFECDIGAGAYDDCAPRWRAATLRGACELLRDELLTPAGVKTRETQVGKLDEDRREDR